MSPEYKIRKLLKSAGFSYCADNVNSIMRERNRAGLTNKELITNLEYFIANGKPKHFELPKNCFEGA